MVLVVKNPPANAGDVRWGSTLESGRSPGRGQGHALQYSCLENSMDRGAWWAMIRRVAKSWTPPKGLSMHTRIGHWWIWGMFRFLSFHSMMALWMVGTCMFSFHSSLIPSHPQKSLHYVRAWQSLHGGVVSRGLPYKALWTSGFW